MAFEATGCLETWDIEWGNRVELHHFRTSVRFQPQMWQQICKTWWLTWQIHDSKDAIEPERSYFMMAGVLFPLSTNDLLGIPSIYIYLYNYIYCEDSMTGALFPLCQFFGLCHCHRASVLRLMGSLWPCLLAAWRNSRQMKHFPSREGQVMKCLQIKTSMQIVDGWNFKSQTQQQTQPKVERLPSARPAHRQMKTVQVRFGGAKLFRSKRCLGVWWRLIFQSLVLKSLRGWVQGSSKFTW